MKSGKLRGFLTKTFLRGLSVALPIVVAIYVVIWLVGDVEVLARAAFKRLFPHDTLYIPGTGVVALILIILLTGLFTYPWITRKLFNAFDTLFRRIPFIGAIYSPVKDLMNLLGGEMRKQLGQPVMVKIPNTDMETLGFVTRDDASGLPEGFLPEGHVVVYVQWSSQIGGYCFLVPRDHTRPVDLTVEEGMRWALTAGLSGPKDSG